MVTRNIHLDIDSVKGITYVNDWKNNKLMLIVGWAVMDIEWGKGKQYTLIEVNDMYESVLSNLQKNFINL